MLEYDDPVIGKILLNKISEYVDVKTEITYNINLGFCTSRYTGLPHLMEHLICRYYELDNKKDNTINAATNEGQMIFIAKDLDHLIGTMN